MGLGTDLNDQPWALISSFGGNAGLFARTNNGTATNTPITASTGQMHSYRIEWTASGLVYYADGALVATHPTPIAANLRPVVSDIFVNTSTVGSTGCGSARTPRRAPSCRACTATEVSARGATSRPTS